MHSVNLHPRDSTSFEYTYCIYVTNTGLNLAEEQRKLEELREDTKRKMSQRIDEFFDSINLMER